MANGAFRFICGDDDFLVHDRGKQAFDSLVAETGADEFSRDVIDGRAGNQAEVDAAIRQFGGAIQTLSLFGSAKVVWFREISFLGDNVTGRAKGTQTLLEDRLKPLLEGVDPEGLKVILTAYPVDRRRSFFKWVQKAADYEYIGGDREGGGLYYQLIQEVCDETGVNMTRAASDLLIERVSRNARLIQAETRKLATYAGARGETIDEDQVNALVPNFGEADFFEAAETFYTLNLETTLAALRRHFFTHADARGLISNLQRMNRLLIQLRVLIDAGVIGSRVNKADLARAAGQYAALFEGSGEKSPYNVFTQNPFYLSRLMRAASRLKLKQLVDFQQTFLRAFESCVERPNDQEVVMREAVIRCLGR